MEKLKTVGVGALVALVVALGVTYFNIPGTQIVREVIKEQLGSVVGPESTFDYTCVGGFCTYNRVGSCNDATSTLFTVQNPAKATSTWTLAIVDVTGSATTTDPYFISVATSTNTGPASTTGWGLISSARVAGNVAAYVRSGTVVATSTTGITGQAFNTGSGLNPGTTTQRIVLGADEYVVGYATGSVDSIVGGTNNFACNYVLQFER